MKVIHRPPTSKRPGTPKSWGARVVLWGNLAYSKKRGKSQSEHHRVQQACIIGTRHNIQRSDYFGQNVSRYGRADVRRGCQYLGAGYQFRNYVRFSRILPHLRFVDERESRERGT